ncbi:MAG: hypothetical protein K2H31_11305, partial [Lachnospiraceae bacterium]|nr:hypothetical protein [Lachnospiraceae bacterium]
MKVKGKYVVSIFVAVIMFCGISGCGSSGSQEADMVEEQDINQVIDTAGTQENNKTTDIIEAQENSQSAPSENLSESASGEDLD